jgi:hypothetical protein
MGEDTVCLQNLKCQNKVILLGGNVGFATGKQKKAGSVFERSGLNAFEGSPR